MIRAGTPNNKSVFLWMCPPINPNLNMLFKKCTNAVSKMDISGGKKRMNAGNKIVPKPKPEKKVRIDAIKAVKGMIKYSIEV